MLLEYLEEIGSDGLAVKDVYAGLRISAPRARARNYGYSASVLCFLVQQIMPFLVSGHSLN